ncbi:DUF554 domain-containing protein [Hydrogenivirga sp. 128-5-R1-1]|uniref:DUF554 domain-containing protein n=1 Tax=Hydrogenivirga sp. 128-5-R1-1 TaxID=392423 RepID=UPI00015F16CE|nr:DUF554 domain-containing protein [Hydrogenivirga sp. 128-5-R1-1]EDP76207.1 hypothetical protein HG1285_18594 [Hydrogenivirga sp. 128-5-R1-1]
MFPGFGTLVNVVFVLLGSFFGLKGARFINPKLREGVIHGIGLFTLILGVKLLVENKPETLKVFFILLIGTAVGYLLNIEGKIEELSDTGKDFTNAFVTSSVLFTVGPMTLLGCILEGTKGDSSLILSKATMDGFSSIILASSLGKGVAFSALFVLLFQGGITLLAFFFGEFLDPQAMANSLFIGGGVMVVIAFKLWGLLKDVKSVNLLVPLVASLFI